MPKHFAILVLIMILTGCGRDSRPMITAPTAAQISEFTGNASIKLRPSAQPVGWREARGMDDALWLQVRMPAEDLQSFLDSSPFRSALLSTNNEYLIYQFRDFLATPPVRYRGGQERLPNGRVLNIVIDESDTEIVVICLMWHET